MGHGANYLTSLSLNFSTWKPRCKKQPSLRTVGQPARDLREDLEQSSLHPSPEPLPACLSPCLGVCPVLESTPGPPGRALVLPHTPAACLPRSVHVCVYTLFFFFLSFYSNPSAMFRGSHSTSVPTELPEPSSTLSSAPLYQCARFIPRGWVRLQGSSQTVSGRREGHVLSL